jgi:hypothetical protein
MEGTIRCAKDIEERINEKSAWTVIDDSSENDPDIHEAHEVIELSGSDVEAEPVKKSKVQTESKKNVAKKPTTVTKAYRSEPPLTQTKCPHNTGAAAATDALASVTSLFHPSKIQECKETVMQISQMTALQTELREV